MAKLQEVQSEKEISKEFYEIFHQTRLMVIRSFQEKAGVGEKMALYSAQRFMQRIIFLFFAVDNGLINNSKLFSERIFEILKKQECTDETKNIWTDINNLFKALDQGDPQLDIHGFGGNLFANTLPENVYFLDFQSKRFFANEIMISKISKEPKLEGKDLETWNEFGKDVSPIIKNLLIMDSYDFKATLNVTILGHILEQSLDDLNEFQKTGNIKRKLEGVFFTPHSLTDYVCKNTIIPYLSKNNVNTIPELISEYHDELEELEEKIENIKIIDPACGSGAFLINAAQILYDISKLIKIKKKNEKKSGTLDVWQKNIETSKIIVNNIFGVDVNPDSVEIAKLSLFLIIAKPGEKLTNLSQNIVRGNSVIDDKEVDQYGNVWKDKFSKIINSGGFDIVIGNPPWQGVKPDVDEFFTPLKETNLLLATKFPNKKQKFSKLNDKQKESIIEECIKKKDILTLYEKYQDKYKIQMDYFGSTSKYSLQGKGDINLYKLFLEMSLQITHKKSLLGLIVPAGIYLDLGTEGLRQEIFVNGTVLELCGFLNKKCFFPEIHAQFKFCSIIFKKTGTTEKFLSKFFVTDADILNNFRKKSMIYDLKEKRKIFSSSTILEISNQTESQIYNKLFKFPTFRSASWNLKVTQELHMTNDKKNFNDTNIGPPLYEGKMIHMFTHKLAQPTRWLDQKQIEERLKEKALKKIPNLIKKKNPNISPKIHSQEYRLVWRIQSNSTDTRSLISTILPPNVYLGNSLGYFIPHIFEQTKYVKLISNRESLFLCGLMNSFMQDFIMRHKISRNINNFHILEQPTPKFDQNNIIHQKIIKNSSMLICTTDEYANLREEIGITEYVTDPEKRLVLEAQINAAAAKIYDLTKEEFEYILESFPSADKNLKEMAMREFLLL